MSEIEVVVPKGMFGPEENYLIEAIMRAVAKVYAPEGDLWAEKYGIREDNDIFMMHPYCWCEKEDCPWCAEEIPNFWYKPTDFKISWYKYIGRDMELNRSTSVAECSEILRDCLLGAPIP